MAVSTINPVQEKITYLKGKLQEEIKRHDKLLREQRRDERRLDCIKKALHKLPLMYQSERVRRQSYVDWKENLEEKLKKLKSLNESLRNKNHEMMKQLSSYDTVINTFSRRLRQEYDELSKLNLIDIDLVDCEYDKFILKLEEELQRQISINSDLIKASKDREIIISQKEDRLSKNLQKYKDANSDKVENIHKIELIEQILELEQAVELYKLSHIEQEDEEICKLSEIRSLDRIFRLNRLILDNISNNEIKFPTYDVARATSTTKFNLKTKSIPRWENLLTGEIVMFHKLFLKKQIEELKLEYIEKYLSKLPRKIDSHNWKECQKDNLKKCIVELEDKLDRLMDWGRGQEGVIIDYVGTMNVLSRALKKQNYHLKKLDLSTEELKAYEDDYGGCNLAQCIGELKEKLPSQISKNRDLAKDLYKIEQKMCESDDKLFDELHKCMGDNSDKAKITLVKHVIELECSVKVYDKCFKEREKIIECKREERDSFRGEIYENNSMLKNVVAEPVGLNLNAKIAEDLIEEWETSWRWK